MKKLFKILLTVFIVFTALYFYRINYIYRAERHNDNVAQLFHKLITENSQEVEKMKKIIESKDNALKYLKIVSKIDNKINIIKENGNLLIEEENFKENFPDFSNNGFKKYRSHVGSDRFEITLNQNDKKRHKLYSDFLLRSDYLIFYKNDPNYKNQQCLYEENGHCECIVIRKITNNWYWQSYRL